MCTIILKGLDKERLSNWIQDAEDKKESDPVHSFIAAWIGFNYYYSTFASQNANDFNRWIRNHFNGRKGDKAQWMFLIQHKLFRNFFNKFRETTKDIFEESVKLPIIDMLNGKSVPENREGEYKLKDLSDLELFEILYQIRNNLFHGSKDPEKNERDMKLSALASRFVLSFLRVLNESTSR